MQGQAPALRRTIDRASGGYRVHVWMAASVDLLLWSDIYASRQAAQRAAFQLRTSAGGAEIEDLSASEPVAAGR